MKVLRTLKATEDATSEPATHNMYLLCDTALALAKAIVEVHSPGTATTGKYPGSIPLPKTFFRQLDLRQLTSECLKSPARPQRAIACGRSGSHVHPFLAS